MNCHFVVIHANVIIRGSNAFICVCLSVCVCVFVRTIKQKRTIAKLATGIVHRESWLHIQYYVKRSNVKVTESQSANVDLKAIEWPA